VSTQSQTRRALGAWYTPPVLVDQLCDAVLEPVLEAAADLKALRICDPTCGDGNFLAEVHRRLQRRGLTARQAAKCLVGVDIDPIAVATCTARLPGADIIEADAIDWQPDRKVDVIVGNPPFVSPLRRHGRVLRGVTDIAVLIAERSLEWLTPDGRCGLVMPLSTVATDQAEVLRTLLARRLDGLWWHRSLMFEAQIATCSLWWSAADHQRAVALHVGADCAPSSLWTRSLDAATWSPLLASIDQFPSLDIPDGPRLGDVADLVGDFRDEYYGLVGHVVEDGSGPPLVVTGAIGVGTSLWGQRPVRFAKQSFVRPTVQLDGLEPFMKRWAQQRLVPKVLVSGQARLLRSAVDTAGEWLPCVPVTTVVPHRRGDLGQLGALLASPAASLWAATVSLGAGRSDDAIKLRPSQLAQMPLSLTSTQVMQAWFEQRLAQRPRGRRARIEQ
jgi:hypothetical protein